MENSHKLFPRKYPLFLALALIFLNVCAFFAIQATVSTSEREETAGGLRAWLRSREALADIFVAVVFTLDIFLLLFLFYLLIKFGIRSLKNNRIE